VCSDNDLSRREFLTRAAALAASAAACRDSSSPPLTQDPSLEHIIVVTMESRSFDHLLGWLPGADGKQAGVSYRDRNGAQHSTHRLTQFHGCGYADPNHSYEGGRQAYNSGACDGWLRADGNDLHAIGYYAAEDQPFLSRLATSWTVCDRYFAPVMAPTFPNRIIQLAGQTDRIVSSQVPCSLPAIWDRLAAKNLSGRHYGALTSSHLWGFRYAGIIRPIAQFHSDAAAGTLPNVAFVDPDLSSVFGGNYHPPDDIRNGEAFLASVYNSVIRSPAWKSALLVVTFDEWGGFFDHVAPPTAPVPPAERAAGNQDGLRGFRVPTVLVSPFARRAHVTSRMYDHASILKLIETRWGLEPLTVRDTEASDLSAEINLSHYDTNAPGLDAPAGPFRAPCAS
jgi:phospholipase C